MEQYKQAGKFSLPPFMGVVLANESADYEAAFGILERKEPVP